MKKILILLYTIFFLNGCNKVDDPEIKKPEIDNADEKIELTVFVEKSDDKELFIKLAERFENESYSIKILSDNETSLYNVNADLVFYNPKNYDLNTLISQNLIKPMDMTEIPVDNYTKRLIEIDGNIYYIPVAADAFGIIANKDVLGDRIELVRHPVSWNDLKFVCDNLKGYAFNLYNSPENKTEYFYSALISSFSEAATIDEHILKQAIGIIEMLYGYTDAELRDCEYEQALNEFATGRAAMIFGSNEDLMNILYIEPSMNLEFIPLPQISDEYNSIVLEYNRVFSVTGNENAKLFIEYFLETDNLNYYINSKTCFSMIDRVKSDIEEYGHFNDNIFAYGYSLNLGNKIENKELVMNEILSALSK